MNSECQLLCPSRTSKLLWLMGLVFTSIVVVQYFELPYEYMLSYLVSASKASSLFISRNNVRGVANSTMSLNRKSEDRISSSVSDGVAISDLRRVDNDRNSEDHSFFEGSNHMSMNSSSEKEKAEVKPVHLTINLNYSSSSTQKEKISSISERKAPEISIVRNATELKKDEVKHRGNEMSARLHSSLGLSGQDCSMVNIPVVKEISGRVEEGVMSISMMNKMLLRSQTSSPSDSMTLCSSASDRELLYARSQIEKATTIKKNSDLYAPIYWNISRFKRSYELMERTLKVYIYREGKQPVFHQPRLKSIYASEGWFMKLMEASKQFVTTNPMEAHLFYLPFSSQLLEEALYVPNSHSFDNLKQYLKIYVDLIKARYSFWNRTAGADHFLVGCHDWAPEETKRLMANCIRALCNADIKEGFQLGKDVSLPETFVQSALYSPKELGGERPSHRQILAFFAGKMHGYVRPILLKHWENRDPDMKIVSRMRKGSYIEHMKSSKYCICARGYEVNSPRVVEAIVYGCVPVIISDNFVPPFLEVLNWEKFALFVLEKDIPNLKNILLAISERRYLIMQWRVKMVRQHFLWLSAPVKYDIFHMILHSIWYNRVFRLTQQ